MTAQVVARIAYEPATSAAATTHDQAASAGAWRMSDDVRSSLTAGAPARMVGAGWAMPVVTPARLP